MVMSHKSPFNKSWVFNKCNKTAYGHEWLTNLTLMVQDFVNSGLADRHFENEIYSENRYKFFQRLFELVLARHLQECGFALQSQGEGPDFSTHINGQKIWIEAVSPTPTQCTQNYIDYINGKQNQVDIQLDKLSLRITSAISDKSKKLKTYLAHNIIQQNDINIIAINHNLLPFYSGHSDTAEILTLLYGVGQGEVKFFLNSPNSKSTDPTFRPTIPKNDRVEVPANFFLCNDHKHVSAIITYDIESNNLNDVVIVHNTNATNSLPINTFVADKEYVARIADNELIITDILANGLNK